MQATPPQPQNPLRVEHVAGVTVARFKSSALLGAEIEAVSQDLHHLARTMQRPRMVVNLSGVTQLSSNMLATLVSLNKAVAEGQGRLVLCDLTPQIYELLNTTRLLNRFRITEEESQALAQFADIPDTTPTADQVARQKLPE